MDTQDKPAVPHWEIRGALSALTWPPIPSPQGAMALAMLHTLEQTQWLPPEQIRERQLRQIESLLRHAWNESPGCRALWQGRYDPQAALTEERFSALPVLKRRTLQEQFEALACRRQPADHGGRSEHRSSGSTGMPVKVYKTALCHVFWNAVTLRDHAWHRRDLRGTLAAVRHNVSEGRYEGWGQATDGVFNTGPSLVIGVREDMDTLLARLVELQPNYLMTYPSIAAELARRALDPTAAAGRLQHLRELRTFGESLSADTRELCMRAWGVPVTDIYSAEEVGYVALQCPAREHYHVQSESLLVEILDDQDRPCAAGSTGRVVVTDLHNFALPLVRYELGDFAEVGPCCDCGRGLPVLRRILGRVRNTLVTATGERYWPTFGSRALAQIASIMQHQMVQLAHDHIEARLVLRAALTVEEEARLRSLVLARLPAGFRLSVVSVDEIARSATGKFEDFVSLVPVAAA